MGKRRAKRGDTGRPDEKGNFVELDWGADEKPKMDPAKVKQIGITAGLGVVLVSALVMFAMTDHTPKRKQTLVKQEKVEPKYQIGRKAVVDTTHVQTALTFSTDILKINKLCLRKHPAHTRIRRRRRQKHLRPGGPEQSQS